MIGLQYAIASMVFLLIGFGMILLIRWPLLIGARQMAWTYAAAAVLMVASGWPG